MLNRNFVLNFSYQYIIYVESFVTFLCEPYHFILSSCHMFILLYHARSIKIRSTKVESSLRTNVPYYPHAYTNHILHHASLFHYLIHTLSPLKVNTRSKGPIFIKNI